MIITRSYAELSRLSSFEERFEYLRSSLEQLVNQLSV